MRLYRVTYIGNNALVTNAQLQTYHNGLVTTFGMAAVGAPIVRDGSNGKLATALFNDGLFTLGTWSGRFFIHALLWRDTIDKKQLEDFTRDTFALTNFRSFLDNMGNYD